MSEQHGSMIKSPTQLIEMVFAAFFIPLIVILLLLTFADSDVKKTSIPTVEQSAKLIKPVGNLQFVDAKAPKVYKTGEVTYQNVCASCHGTGAAGAPMFENKAQWAPRISHGYDYLVHNAINGKNAMPARGGLSPDDGGSDYEIALAVAYMANASGGKFAEPKPPESNETPQTSPSSK
jgi:cytochrome c5